MNTKRDSWNNRYAAKGLVWSAAPNQLLIQQVDGLNPGAALDLGCGEGRNAIWLAEQGWNVTAVDFSEVGVSKAQRIASNRGVKVNWQVRDVVQPFPVDQYFDLVIILFLHTSTIEREAWFSSASRAVAPGGTLIYIGHDKKNISAGVGGPRDPSVLPTSQEVIDRLAGFKIEASGLVERSVMDDPGHTQSTGKRNDQEGRGSVALDCLVRATRD